MEKDTGFLRLLSVSKLFYEAHIPELYKEISELKKENEELKLKLFWEEHKYQNLKEMQLNSNRIIGTLRCNCTGCCCNMIWRGQMDRTKVCAFVPWFTAKLDACGLTYGEHVENDPFNWRLSGLHHKAYNVDASFIMLKNYFDPDDTNSSCIIKFIYGPRIRKAKTVDDPELQKLEMLMGLMEQEVEEIVYS